MSKVFLGLLILFEIIADVAAKEFSIQGKWAYFIGALTAYVLANISWLVSLRYKSELAVGANIFSVTTGLLALAIGTLLYGETLSAQQYVGVLLGTVSLFLLL